MSVSGARELLISAWQARPARERRLIALAMGLVLLALVWWLALAPAVSTLRAAPAQQARLSAQAERMQGLQREAQALQALPRLERAAVLHALESATQRRLGASARLAVVGDRAQITLKDTPAQDLAAWLAEVRSNARATPIEARLTRTGDANAGVSLRWSGTLALGLPA